MVRADPPVPAGQPASSHNVARFRPVLTFPRDKSRLQGRTIALLEDDSNAVVVSYCEPAAYLRLRQGMNALVVLCIALGVILWVATGSLYQSLEKSIVVTLNPLSEHADLQIVNDPRGVPRTN